MKNILNGHNYDKSSLPVRDHGLKPEKITEKILNKLQSSEKIKSRFKRETRTSSFIKLMKA